MKHGFNLLIYLYLYLFFLLTHYSKKVYFAIDQVSFQYPDDNLVQELLSKNLTSLKSLSTEPNTFDLKVTSLSCNITSISVHDMNSTFRLNEIFNTTSDEICLLPVLQFLQEQYRDQSTELITTIIVVYGKRFDDRSNWSEQNLSHLTQNVSISLVGFGNTSQDQQLNYLGANLIGNVFVTDLTTTEVVAYSLATRLSHSFRISSIEEGTRDKNKVTFRVASPYFYPNFQCKLGRVSDNYEPSRVSNAIVGQEENSIICDFSDVELFFGNYLLRLDILSIAIYDVEFSVVANTSNCLNTPCLKVFSLNDDSTTSNSSPSILQQIITGSGGLLSFIIPMCLMIISAIAKIMEQYFGSSRLTRALLYVSGYLFVGFLISNQQMVKVNVPTLDLNKAIGNEKKEQESEKEDSEEADSEEDSEETSEDDVEDDSKRAIFNKVGTASRSINMSQNFSGTKRTQADKENPVDPNILYMMERIRGMMQELLNAKQNHKESLVDSQILQELKADIRNELREIQEMYSKSSQEKLIGQVKEQIAQECNIMLDVEKKDKKEVKDMGKWIADMLAKLMKALFNSQDANSDSVSQLPQDIENGLVEDKSQLDNKLLQKFNLNNSVHPSKLQRAKSDSDLCIG